MTIRVTISMLAAAAALTTALAVPALANQPSPTASATQPFYRNCDEARAAGAAPIRRGEPGYRPALDRDNDGVACDGDSSPGTGSPNPSSSPSPTPTATPVPRPSPITSGDHPADKDEKKQAPIPKPVKTHLPVTH